MKKQFYTFVTIIAAMSLVSCGNDKDKNAQAQQRQSQVKPVKTIKIPTGDYTTFDKYPTSIEGIVNSEARPKVSGYITDVLVDEGQKVKKGQLLFKLETKSLSGDAQAAKANINAAQVQVNQLKPLVKKDIVSKSQLETAQAKLEQAKSNYNSITANIGYANVKSPVNGYVGQIRIRKGNLVSPSDAKPLTTVSDINKLYAYFSMNEKDYLNFLKTAEGKTRDEKIKNLPKVTLVMANGQEYKHKGTIQTINSQIDKQTGSVSFRAIFDNPEQTLTNGSTGEIKVPKTYKDALVIPQKSTYERQGRTYVMKIQKTDSSTVALSTTIQIKDRKDNIYMVGGQGVKEGDQIIAEGPAKTRSGTPVKPQEEPFDSVAKPLNKIFK